MAGRAGVRHLVLVRHGRSNELECVGADKRPGHALRFYLGHMTRYTLTARASILVVGMLFPACDVVRTIRGCRAVAIQAELLSGFAKLRVVLCPMNIMTGYTGDSTPVHQALHIVVALHPVLMSSSIWKVREGRLAQSEILKLPIVRQFQANPIADWPVIGFSFNLFRQRLPLRMTLDAGVIRRNVIHL